MKAFMLSVVALVLLTGGAAVIAGGFAETSQDTFTSSTGNVRH
ncbi:MAG: hypothetical protein RIC14_01880 [Filomicrobium sp.]